MECKHVWAHISGYLDSNLTLEERASVEKHLAHCEICSAVLDSVRNVIVLTTDDRVIELPVGYSDRLHDRLRRELAA